MKLTRIAGFEHRDANATKPAAEHISYRDELRGHASANRQVVDRQQDDCAQD
jgi:hypothetical protein